MLNCAAHREMKRSLALYCAVHQRLNKSIALCWAAFYIVLFCKKRNLLWLFFKVSDWKTDKSALMI